MSISQTTLKDEIQSALELYSDNIVDAANAIASAYATYTSTAVFGTSVPTFTTQETVLAATILSGMTGTFSAFATAIQTGVLAFWLGVPCAGGSGAGVTISPTGGTLIAAALIAAVGTQPYQDEIEQVATELASILHTATLTTTATLTIPPAGPVIWPIS